MCVCVCVCVFTSRFPVKKWYPTRQYFTIGDDPKTRKVLTPGTTLESYGLKNNDTLIFKDLGPQISWKTVFHVEYAGPILMHALFYYLPNLFYPGYQPEQYVKSYTQKKENKEEKRKKTCPRVYWQTSTSCVGYYPSGFHGRCFFK